MLKTGHASEIIKPLIHSLPRTFWSP